MTTDQEVLLLADLLSRNSEMERDFDVATRIFGFAEPTIYYDHADRNKRQRPRIGFRKAGIKGGKNQEKNFWGYSWRAEYGKAYDIDGKEILDENGRPRPGNLLASIPEFHGDHAWGYVEREMRVRGYEFALRRVGSKWGASFHGTAGEVVPGLLDSDTPEEAIVKAALRTLQASSDVQGSRDGQTSFPHESVRGPTKSQEAGE